MPNHRDRAIGQQGRDRADHAIDAVGILRVQVDLQPIRLPCCDDVPVPEVHPEEKAVRAAGCIDDLVTRSRLAEHPW
jgi:hypothetical protein